MFRVPTNSESPSFDNTFKISFFGWLTSKKADRREWMRRRNIAAKLARINLVADAEAKRQAAHGAWDTRRGEIMEDSQVRAERDRTKRAVWEDGKLAKLEQRAVARGDERMLAKVRARRKVIVVQLPPAPDATPTDEHEGIVPADN